MSETRNIEERAAVLLMLSGGRDSFLSACRLVENGYNVNMITYDNGHISHAEYAEAVAGRIIEMFGEEQAKFVGIQAIVQNIRPLMKKALYLEPVQLAEKYPHLLHYQVSCLACHTAMYLHSIAYCLANEIKVISEGAREQQGFFVELPEMSERYEKLCKQYEIELVLPVYNLQSDDERIMELSEWEFHPKSMEPKCWLGCPLCEPLKPEQRNDLAAYYDKEMLPQLDSIIQRLEKKKRCKKDGQSTRTIYI